MPVAPTPFFANPEAARRILSEEERADITKMRELQDMLRKEAGKAKFKIELLFTRELSTREPCPGVISFWESGAKLHGGGDTILHFCPGKSLGRNDCEHYIPDPSNGYGILVCPRCHSVWDGKQVIGQYLARLPIQKWAEVICKYYRQLDMNCDVVVKYHKNDIRAAMRARHIQDSLGVLRAPAKRLKRIYTLGNLLRDTSAGSALYDRILAFLKA
jgi:hypothetical protein